MFGIFVFSLLVEFSLSDSVVRLFPRTAAELIELESFAQRADLDWWKDPSGIQEGADVRLRADQLYLVEALAGIERTTIIPDVDALQTQPGNATRFSRTKVGNFGCIDTYLPYGEIELLFEELVTKHADVARAVVIGHTFQGRAIRGVEVNIDATPKRGLFVDGGIHAREWIAPATAINILLNLLERQSEPDVHALLRAYTVTVVPVLNIDGFIYTHTTNRMWRKTRRPNPDGSFGVDANRNSNVEFCQRGASSVPSSDSYCGPFPESEPEVAATLAYIKSLGNVLVYWNLHSYGQEIIVPYAFTDAFDPPDHDDHIAAGWRFWEGIFNSTGMEYDAPRPPNGVYSGFLMDNLYINYGVKYSGLLELRDLGRYGFLLPEDQICEQGLEIWSGLLPHSAFAIAHP
jgi:carboxypeptidase A2